LIENFTLGGGAQVLVTSALFAVEVMGDQVAILLAEDTPEVLEEGVHVLLVHVLLTGIPEMIIPIHIHILDQDLFLDLSQDHVPDPDLRQDHSHHPAARHDHHLINAVALKTIPLRHTVPPRVLHLAAIPAMPR